MTLDFLGLLLPAVFAVIGVGAAIRFFDWLTR